MTPKNLQSALKSFTRRAPFRSFIIELVHGGAIDISHPEAVRSHGELLAYVTPQWKYYLFDSSSVVAVRDR